MDVSQKAVVEGCWLGGGRVCAGKSGDGLFWAAADRGAMKGRNAEGPEGMDNGVRGVVCSSYRVNGTIVLGSNSRVMGREEEFECLHARIVE